MFYRIDPINEKGKFDLEFYESEEYNEHIEKLKHYLNSEGFNTISKSFIINFNGHQYECKPQTMS
jgi:hypothetical protein